MRKRDYFEFVEKDCTQLIAKDIIGKVVLEKSDRLYTLILKHKELPHEIISLQGLTQKEGDNLYRFMKSLLTREK